MNRKDRIAMLREMALSKSHLSYVKKKTLITTDIEKQECNIIARAKDFEKYLNESEPFIQDWELIVGGRSLIATLESTLSVGFADRIHNTPNYAKILDKGLGGIYARAKELFDKTSDKEKKDYYKAVEISYRSASDFIKKYAILASKMSIKEKDKYRKDELLKISEICSSISTEPAKSFWQAIQLLWFSSLLAGGAKDGEECRGPIGRLDQFLYPYYKNDISKGFLTKEQAQELLECLWVKFNTRILPSAYNIYDNGCNIVVGGVTADGKDATNELTYMCLDATANVRLVDPKINVRIHEDNDRKLIEESCRVISMGIGMPCIYNDRNAIPALMSTGIPLKDAREYTNDGCTELYIPGKSDLSFYVCNMLQESYNFLINSDLEVFETFDQFFGAFKGYLAFLLKSNCVPVAVGSQNRNYSAFFSAMFDDCLERGIPDLKGGAIYNVRGVVLKSIVNCVDALSAIKKFIYDEKSLSWNELINALKANFNGYEALRQKLAHTAPKFGNDDDYVDLIASDLVNFLCDESGKYDTGTGLRYAVGLMTWLDQGVEHKFPSADGRRADDLIASNFSPSPGRDTKGPTAIINSVNKIKTSKAGHGAVLDLKFHPSALADDGLEKFVYFVDSALKGDHVITLQINVVDKQTLINAKKNPDLYRDLVIRVRGFSAYFVDLDPWMQEQIIERTELAF